MVDIIAAIKNLKKIFGLPAQHEELPWPVIEPMAPAEEVLLTTGRPWNSTTWFLKKHFDGRKSPGASFAVFTSYV